MDFKTNKPIYRQIVDLCLSKILTKEWQTEERIPSVREFAALLMVNPHTVLKAFEFLQTEEVIYPKRGMGFFLAKDAINKVMKIQKKEFFETTLKETFSAMDLLGISINEILDRYVNWKK